MHPAPAATATNLPLARAINAGLRAAMSRDDKVLVMGEDVGPLGGVFRVTDGLQAEFGKDRVVDTPLAESGIVGTAVGLALAGYRPVVEIQFDGFIFPSYNQITTQLAKLTYRTQGQVQMPVVIRVPYGGHIGAIEHHSESPEALFAHTAGIRIVTPATAADGYSMIQQAIASPDPVLFLEPKSRYWEKGPVELDEPTPVDDDALTRDLHAARVVRPGADVTIATYGPGVKVSLQAADVAQQDGSSVEVIGLGAPHGPARGRPRGAHVLRAGSRAGRRGLRALLLRPRGAGAPGRRLPHALPGLRARVRLPALARPYPRCRRAFARRLSDHVSRRSDERHAPPDLSPA
jgi:pyruvate dehydrogenase E1 component beta subunit